MTATNEQTRGMKAKTIKAILSKKFTSFVASIEDEEVRNLVNVAWRKDKRLRPLLHGQTNVRQGGGVLCQKIHGENWLANES